MSPAAPSSPPAVPRPRLALVFNPVAGSFRDDRLAALIAALEGAGFAVTACPTRADGVQVPDAVDLVCVHGGDGTLRDCVRALGPRAGTVPLCVAPSGTVNLVARELGYVRDPSTFARQLADAWARGPDSWVRAPLHALGDLPVVSCLSLGPDSHAVAHVSGTLKKRIGRYAYAVALMRLLRDWPRATLTITGETDEGASFSLEAEAAVVSHSALYAGPFRLSPRAALAANSVELVAIRHATRAAMASLIARAILRRPLNGHGGVTIVSCRRIEFGEAVHPVQVDGDHMPECGRVIAPTGMALTYVV